MEKRSPWKASLKRILVSKTWLSRWLMIFNCSLLIRKITIQKTRNILFSPCKRFKIPSMKFKNWLRNLTKKLKFNSHRLILHLKLLIKMWSITSIKSYIYKYKFNHLLFWKPFRRIWTLSLTKRQIWTQSSRKQLKISELF